MTNRNADDSDTRHRFEALSARLGKLQGERAQPSEASERGTAIGRAFRLSAEFVIAVIVGGGMGWLLDDWLHTRPWLFFLFLILGMAAGIKNVLHTAKKMNAEAARHPMAPAVSDDDD
jgi:ATP synthase protein I